MSSELVPAGSGSELERVELAPGWRPDDAIVPRFVIIGAHVRGGRLVMATSQLTSARFASRVQGYQEVPVLGRKARIPVTEHALLAEFPVFASIHGTTFPSALSSLATVWNPDD